MSCRYGELPTRSRNWSCHEGARETLLNGPGWDGLILLAGRRYRQPAKGPASVLLARQEMMLLCSIHAIVLFFMPYALGSAPSLRRAGKVSRLTCRTKKHSCRRPSCTDVITGRPFAGDA